MAELFLRKFPMHWKITAELLFLAPFAFVAFPLLAVETARAVAAIRAERS